MTDLLNCLSATAAMLALCLAMPATLLWLGILLHELAHAGAAKLLGGTILAGYVGAGSQVLPVRWFGVRWEFRWIPRHGLVRAAMKPGPLYRTRMVAFLLAGPMCTTAIMVVLVMLWAGQARPHVVEYWDMPLDLGLLMSAMVFGGTAVLAWLPIHVSIGGQSYESDVLRIWRLLRQGPADPAAVAQAHAKLLARHRVFEAFYAGDYAAALAGHRQLATDSGFANLADEALLLWPVEGAAAARAKTALAEQEFQVWRRNAKPGPGQGPRALRRFVLYFEKLFLVNRAFFAAVGNDDSMLRAADLDSAAAMRRFPRDAAVLRTRGLVELRLGKVGAAMAKLRLAWRRSEPVSSRSLCALYLALGHALRGDERSSGRFLEKSRRLDPRSPLLEEYSGRIGLALAMAPAAAGNALRLAVAPPSRSE